MAWALLGFLLLLGLLAGKSTAKRSTVKTTAGNSEPETKEEPDMVTTVKGATLNRGINVMDHGAVGDGVTDDYAAFVAANTYADTYGYSSVYVPDLTFYLGTTPSDALSDKLYGPGTLLVGTQLRGLNARAGISVNTSDTRVSGGFVLGGQGPSSNGMQLASSTSTGWTIQKPTKFGQLNLTQLYPNAIDFCAWASASNVLTLSAGKDVSDDVIDVGDSIWWGKTRYLVAAKLTSTTIQVSTTAGGDPGFTTHASESAARSAGGIETGYFVYNVAEGTCNTVSGVMTVVSGDHLFNSAQHRVVKINGTIYRDGVAGVTLTWDSNTQLTITGAAVPDATGVPFVYKAQQGVPMVTGFVIQGRYGSDEENVYQYVATTGRFHFESSYAGDGQYMPMVFRTGPQAAADDWFAETADTASSRVMMYADESGKITFGNGFSGAFDAYRVGVSRHLPTSITNSTTGSTESLSLCLRNTYKSDNEVRQLTIGSFNDYQGFFLQSEEPGTGASGLQIQPTESAVSKLFIGKKGATIPDAKVVIGDPVAASPAHGAAIAPAQDDKYSLGTAAQGFTKMFLANGVLWMGGAGTPEGVVSAPVGSLFSRTDGGAGTSFYVKESGTGNTGWVGK